MRTASRRKWCGGEGGGVQHELGIKVRHSPRSTEVHGISAGIGKGEITGRKEAKSAKAHRITGGKKNKVQL